MYSIKASTCVCNEENPLPISTLFTIALLVVIELQPKSVEVVIMARFPIKAVSTYNFEVKCVFKVGVVFVTNTLSAFKSPTIVCNPVNVFAKCSFALESNAVCNPSDLAILKTPS
jgi:hypothetical protein